MRFALSGFGSTFALLTAVMAISTVGCGAKGDDDDSSNTGGTGGTGGNPVEMVFAFDTTTEGFTFQDYAPGDAMYHNIFHEDMSSCTLTNDGGDGSDGMPGRAKLVMNFSDWNQLADIQVNFSGDSVKSWLNKKLKAQVMLETGFSTNPSCPGGTYMFLKTGATYVWARGQETNLDQTGIGTWNTVTFTADIPSQANDKYDPAEVVSIGLQFYSGSGTSCPEMPRPVTAYVDSFTVENAPAN